MGLFSDYLDLGLILGYTGLFVHSAGHAVVHYRWPLSFESTMTVILMYMIGQF